MTWDEASKIAKANPGQGIREATMQPRWKIVYVRWKKSRLTRAGAAFFCINPITGGDYEFRLTPEYAASKNWSLI